MNSNPEDASHHKKRSREDLEALAKDFVATPVEEAAPPKPRTRAVLAVGGIAILAALAFVVWPEREAIREVQPDTTRAAAEAEQWRQRYEAERERKRQQLASGKEYLERMAAADSALLKEMASRASKLTEVEEAPPEPAAARQPPKPAEPTPKESASTPKPATAPKSTQQTAAAKPAPAPAPAPAEKAAPQPAAQEPATVAEAPSCKLHVSQLSSTGKLTYADVSRMKGVRTDSRGHVFTPPMTLDDGRRVIFEVMPDGCMKWRRA